MALVRVWGMQRRTFLQRMLLAGGLPLLPHCAQARETEDVIVIGAGLAGLAAARALRNAGREVLILEGRDRLGGRICTDHRWGLPVDLGAAWIHGIEHNPVARLARQQGLRLVTTDYERSVTFDLQGRPWGAERAIATDRQMEQWLARLESRDSSGSLAEATRNPPLPPDPRFLLTVNVEHEYGADLADLPTAYATGEGRRLEGEDVLLPGGLEPLVVTLARDLRIRTGVTVTAIRQDAGGVRLTTSQGEVRGRQVCCTVPLGVLQSGTIRFEPDLPAAHRRAIARLGMGLLDKLVLRFPRPFWDPDLTLIRQQGPAPGLWAEWLNLMPVLGQPMLVGFNAGTVARELYHQPEAAVIASGLATLRRLYGSRVPEPTGGCLTRWGMDPFSRGSYSYLKLGAEPGDRQRLAQPVGPLVFAGEATSVDYPGTLQGAYESGLRAARQLLEA